MKPHELTITPGAKGFLILLLLLIHPFPAFKVRASLLT